MNILQIISSGGMYGAESVILNLSHALNDGSHRSILGVFSNTSNPNLQLHERALKESIESFVIPCNGQVDRATFTAIRELAVQVDADIIHAHGYKADIYSYLALRRSHVPLVATCHNWLEQNAMVTLYGIADRIVLRKYARVVAVSDEVRQKLLKCGVREEKICMVRNGIDLRPMNEALPSLLKNARLEATLIVGWVGRLSKEKGVDIFLRAAANVLIDFADTKFVVVGEGPDRDKLDRLIDELGISKSVSILGRREDMPSIYASLDIMVSSSRQEGLPMAILEGMASRLPLVATAVGDVPTVVKDGRTGVLVPAEDVEALAKGISSLLHDPATRIRLGTAARQLIEDEYSAQRMTADYLRMYEEAIEVVHKSKSL